MSDLISIRARIQEAINNSPLNLASRETKAWYDRVCKLDFGIGRSMYAPPQVDWTTVYRRVAVKDEHTGALTYVYAKLNMGMREDEDDASSCASSNALAEPLPVMALPALMELRRPFTPSETYEDAATLLSLCGLALAMRSGGNTQPYDYRTGLTYRFEVPSSEDTPTSENTAPETFDLNHLNDTTWLDTLLSDRLVLRTVWKPEVYEKHPPHMLQAETLGSLGVGDFPLHLTTVAGRRHVVTNSKSLMNGRTSSIPDVDLYARLYVLHHAHGKNLEVLDADPLKEWLAVLVLPRIGYQVGLRYDKDKKSYVRVAFPMSTAVQLPVANRA